VKKPNTDAINPPHYRRGRFECADVIEDLGLDFFLGNAFKYLWRAGHKDDVLQDLKKAQWYLNRAVEQREVKR